MDKYKKVIGFLSQLDRDSIERIGEEFSEINDRTFLHFMGYNNIIKVFSYLEKYFPNGVTYKFKRKDENYYSIFGKIYCETNLKKWYTETTEVYIYNYFEWKTFSVLTCTDDCLYCHKNKIRREGCPRRSIFLLEEFYDFVLTIIEKGLNNNE